MLEGFFYGQNLINARVSCIKKGELPRLECFTGNRNVLLKLYINFNKSFLKS